MPIGPDEVNFDINYSFIIGQIDKCLRAGYCTFDLPNTFDRSEVTSRITKDYEKAGWSVLMIPCVRLIRREGKKTIFSTKTIIFRPLNNKDQPLYLTMALSEIISDSRCIRRESIEVMKKLISTGPMKPIIVKQNEDGKFIIVDGHSRYAALKELGYNDAPVEVQC